MVTRLRTAVARVVGFGLVPAFSLASTVLVLPLVAERFGPDGWTAVSVGSAAGAFVGVVTGLSWPVVGPYMVAAAGPRRRRSLYRHSLVSRVVALGVSAPIAVCVVWLLTAPTGHGLTAAAVCLAVGTNGLTAAWFHVGAGRPAALVRNEALVRCVAHGVVVAVLALGAPLWSYGVVMIGAGVVMLCANHVTVLGWNVRAPRRGSASPVPIREHCSGTLARLAQSSFLSLTPVLFAVSGSAGTSVFTALDQVQKAATNGLGAVPQAAVSLTAAGHAGSRVRRLLLATAAAFVLAAVLMLAWSVCSERLLDLLFRGRHGTSDIERVVSGAAIAGLFLAQFVHQVPVAGLGLARASYLPATVVGVAAAPAFVVSAATWGVVGASAVVLGASGALVLWYAALVLGRLRRPDPVP
jgi:hypothetical protein